MHFAGRNVIRDSATEASWRKMLLLRGPVSTYTLDILMRTADRTWRFYKLENHGLATLGGLVDYVLERYLNGKDDEEGDEEQDQGEEEDEEQDQGEDDDEEDD